MDIESSQEVSLDNWGKQLLENILLTAAEAVGERREISDSIDVTLTFRLTPIVSKDHLEVSVAFKRDPTLITHIPGNFDSPRWTQGKPAVVKLATTPGAYLLMCERPQR